MKSFIGFMVVSLLGASVSVLAAEEKSGTGKILFKCTLDGSESDEGGFPFPSSITFLSVGDDQFFVNVRYTGGGDEFYRVLDMSGYQAAQLKTKVKNGERFEKIKMKSLRSGFEFDLWAASRNDQKGYIIGASVSDSSWLRGAPAPYICTTD